MAMPSLPVRATAVKTRQVVAAIDFGTTYSGYAFSLKSDFDVNPLKIIANNWETCADRSSMVSSKAPSCVLFKPDREFHSFGYEAENHYTRLAMDGEHHDWFFYKRFKMLLYENMDLKRKTELADDKGLKMSALKVFSECIRYLKDHLLDVASDKDIKLKESEIHWVLTVPAIWNDSAKQFMRESAVEAGIHTESLSLALEPEAASLYCRHLPVEKVQGADGTTAIAQFAPGKRYLVLDAGGGTVDITVHETQADGTVREVYKANGGPWGGTRIDQAYLAFLEDVAGKAAMEMFTSNYREDYLEMMREFEIKKKSFDADMDPNTKITFRIPLTLHESYKTVTGGDFRRSLMMRQSLKDKVTFTGDKLRVPPENVMEMFEETTEHIVNHLQDILSKAATKGTEAILMVGGFSESKVLQNAIKKNFNNLRVIVPEDAGLAVLMGAVVFGHRPTAIISRMSKFTYGIRTYKTFNPAVHSADRRKVVDGRAKCRNCFSRHVEVDQEITVGTGLEEKVYSPLYKDSTRMGIDVYTSDERKPIYVDDGRCRKLGSLRVDLSGIEDPDEKDVCVKMIYGDTELGVEAKIVKTGKIVKAKFNFLG